MSPHATGLSGRGSKSVWADNHRVSLHATRLTGRDSTSVCADYRIGHLRMPLDSQVTITKGGVVDKSRAFAPMHPQFVMKNSDLRSSCESSVRLK